MKRKIKISQKKKISKFAISCHRLGKLPSRLVILYFLQNINCFVFLHRIFFIEFDFSSDWKRDLSIIKLDRLTCIKSNDFEAIILLFFSGKKLSKLLHSARKSEIYSTEIYCFVFEEARLRVLAEFSSWVNESDIWHKQMERKKECEPRIYFCLSEKTDHCIVLSSCFIDWSNEILKNDGPLTYVENEQQEI